MSVEQSPQLRCHGCPARHVRGHWSQEGRCVAGFTDEENSIYTNTTRVGSGDSGHLSVSCQKRSALPGADITHEREINATGKVEGCRHLTLYDKWRILYLVPPVRYQ